MCRSIRQNIHRLANRRLFRRFICMDSRWAPIGQIKNIEPIKKRDLKCTNTI